MKEETRSMTGKLALVVVGVLVVVAAIGALTYQHSGGAPVANPPQGNRCVSSSTPCQVPLSVTSIFGKCWLSVGVSRLEVLKNTSVSWTLSPLGGDPVQFYDPNLVIQDNGASPDFAPPKIDSSKTTVTVTATGNASGNALSYAIYARRIKGSGPADYDNCWATNPLIVNVPQ